MTYNLPAHGEGNWDAKLDPSMQYLKDTAEAAETPAGAQAKATAAQNAAISAAATDATTKANNAQSAAISAAATDATTKANSVQSNLNTHTGNLANPHSVTKAQVGLGNVDNTSDANKPVSTAQQVALNAKQNTASLDNDVTAKFNDTASAVRSALDGVYDGRAKRIDPWQPNHAYAVGDQFITGFVTLTGYNFTDISHRRWYVSTTYTSGAAFSTTDTANAFVLLPSGTAGSLGWAFFEEGDTSQGRRIRTNQPMWVLPDKSYPTDALYARKGDPTKSTLELEGAVDGPSTGRIMGVIVWDNGNGSLGFVIEDDGDVVLGAQRHLLSSDSSGTAAVTPATAVAASTALGTSPPAPALAAGATDMRGIVYFGTGTGAGSGRMFRVTFGRAYPSPPVVLVGGANGNAPGLNAFVDQANDVDTAGFYVRTNVALGSGAGAGTYALSYHVMG